MKKLVSLLLALAMVLSVCSFAVAATTADLSVDLSFGWFDTNTKRTVEAIGDTISLSEISSSPYELRVIAGIKNNGSTQFNSTSLILSDGTHNATWSNDYIEANTGYFYSAAQLSGYTTAGTIYATLEIDGRIIASKLLTITGSGSASGSTGAAAVCSMYKTVDADINFVWYNTAKRQTALDLGDEIDLSMVTNSTFEFRIAGNLRNMGSSDFTSTTLEITDGDGSAVWSNDLIEAGEGYFYSSGKLSGYTTPGTYYASVIIDGQTVCTQTLRVVGSSRSGRMTYVSNMITRNENTGYVNHVLSGDTVRLSDLPSDNYLSLRLLINNDTSSTKSVSVYAMLDGNRVDWNTATVSAHDYWCFNIGQSTMERYAGGTGSHTIKWYVNDELVQTQTYTVK